VSALETPRLRLRLLDAQDEALFCHLYTDPDVMRRILPPLSMEAAVGSFRHACRHNTRDTPGHRFWTIEDKASNASPGMAALLRSGDSAELGVMLRKGWWNQGISSEAFAPLLGHAFQGMGLLSIHAQRPDDEHARLIDRLLGRFGFERVPERAPPGQARWELPRIRWTCGAEHEAV
jgi:RimJ/RimL family protein N-acetyltransferase